MNYTTSKQLIKNTKGFLDIKKHYLFSKIHKNTTFYGWGRKKSGQKAIKLAKKYDTNFVLLEDGFIRSLGLGVEGAKSFSIVCDDIGIYYDATSPSRLENILNSYDFDEALLNQAQKAKEFLLQNHISKYNNAKNIDKEFIKKYKLEEKENNILIISQVGGDASLEYGMLKPFSTKDIIDDAIKENPNSNIYIKIHPDVLSGKKKSDFDVQKLDSKIVIIDENINPISLLKQFKKVYTKTSGMGFEALLCGCECVCYGMPFYAGWGVTIDKGNCKRRVKKRTVIEIFAASYILYSIYYNPYENRNSDIFDTMREIVKQRAQ